MTIAPGKPSLIPHEDADPCPRVEITVTAGADNQRITVYRYSSQGRTIVRGADRQLVGGLFYVVDYETPLGEEVYYTAVGYNSLGVVSNEGPASDPVELNPEPGCPWVQDPTRPLSARRLQVGDWSTWEYARDNSVLWPIISKRAIVVTGPRRDATSTIQFLTGTVPEWEAIKDLFDSTILLFRFDDTWDPVKAGYFFVDDVTETRRSLSDRKDARRLWTADIVPVTQTASSLVSAIHTWAEVVQYHATWAALMAAKATWLDVVKNPAPGGP